MVKELDFRTALVVFWGRAQNVQEIKLDRIDLLYNTKDYTIWLYP